MAIGAAEAEEYTQTLALGLTVNWRQIRLGERMGVPDALGLTTREWVGRLGGYVRLTVEERRDAAKELTAEGLSTREAADVLGVSNFTVAKDIEAVRNLTDEQKDKQDTVRNLTDEAAAVLHKPDWKPKAIQQVSAALEGLPEEARPTVAAMLNEPAVPPKVALAMVENLGAMPANERDEVLRLYVSDDARERSLAKTRAAAHPPEPDPRTIDIGEAVRALRRGVQQFPDDPLNDRLTVIIAALNDLRRDIIAQHKERTG